MMFDYQQRPATPEYLQNWDRVFMNAAPVELRVPETLAPRTILPIDVICPVCHAAPAGKCVSQIIPNLPLSFFHDQRRLAAACLSGS